MSNKLIPLTLEQHQKILYEILYMVDDFCKEHDIPYFLVGGTLLGAARHQGIIPWDDDVDIAMTRENYNRFIDLFHSESVEGYELHDYEHTKGYIFPFAKITKKGTWTSDGETNMIHIDIFTYDGCGDTLQKSLSYFKKGRNRISDFIKWVSPKISFNRIYDCWKAKLVYFVTKFPIELVTIYPFLISEKRQKDYLRKTITKISRYSVNNKKFSSCIVWGLYGEGEVQLSSSFIVLDKMRFGARDLPVPSGWHDYLTGLYGDYMKPLPENKRARHCERSYIVAQ